MHELSTQLREAALGNKAARLMTEAADALDELSKPKKRAPAKKKVAAKK